MAKSIVYIIVDSGMDGKGDRETIYASFVEDIRDSVFNLSRNNIYYYKQDVIIDPDVQYKSSLTKLNALDKLLLGLDQKVLK